MTFTAITPADREEPDRARDRHTLATHRLSVLNAISEAKKSVPPQTMEPSKSVFFDASTLKKKLKEDLCKDGVR